MKLYKIESGIKLPDISTNNGDGKQSMANATLTALKVGQSFLVRDGLEAMKAAKVMRDLKRRDRKTGAKRDFASRQVKGGMRFWRTR